MRHLLPRKCLKKIYKSLVRSKLDYADVIYDNCSIQDSNTLEKVQRRAALLLTGAIRLTKHNILLKELGLETLKTRRRSHRLIYLYKIKNKLTPEYLYETCPIVNHNDNVHNLRRNNQLLQLQTRTTAYFNSFFPTTIRDWNSLPGELLTASSISIFKKLLKENVGNVTSKLFSLGHGLGKVNHTRIRLGLSGLNDHLFKYNLSATKICSQCQSRAIENSVHYFTSCDRYSAIRSDLLTSLRDILCPNVSINLLLQLCPTYLTEIILEGSTDLTTNENFEIFKATFTFIENSNRFSNN